MYDFLKKTWCPLYSWDCDCKTWQCKFLLICSHHVESWWLYISGTKENLLCSYRWCGRYQLWPHCCVLASTYFLELSLGSFDWARLSTKVWQLYVVWMKPSQPGWNLPGRFPSCPDSPVLPPLILHFLTAVMHSVSYTTLQCWTYSSENKIEIEINK